MEIEFFFRIETNDAKKTSAVLGLLATRESPYWEYSCTKVNDLEMFVGDFLEKLESNKKSLGNINVSVPDDISFWYMYEYDGQCNIEFDSSFLQALGSKGIDLCISCWKKNDNIEF